MNWYVYGMILYVIPLTKSVLNFTELYRLTKSGGSQPTVKAIIKSCGSKVCVSDH